MKGVTVTALAIMLAIGLTLSVNETATAQDHGNGYTVRGFLDENGDGFNDLAPDDDGDGIPNGQDPDYAPPRDGTGNQFGKDTSLDGSNMFQHWFRHMFQWNNGGNPDNGNGQGPGNGYGPGDGSGNDGNGPHDGSGYGPGRP